MENYFCLVKEKKSENDKVRIIKFEKALFFFVLGILVFSGKRGN